MHLKPLNNRLIIAPIKPPEVNNRTRLIPPGKERLRQVVFYWVTYTASVIAFAVTATSLSILGASNGAAFIVAFLISCAMLITLYLPESWRLLKRLGKRHC